MEKDQEERIFEETMHIYTIDRNQLPYDDSLPSSDQIFSVFSHQDSYWMNGLQKVRFDDCKSRGILYRPKIVKDMTKAVEYAFEKGGPTGIMIKGPHGIGKSHSLVNLVRKLQYGSSCKYLVTFIPDCDKWEDVDDLYTAICSSFGTSLSALSWSSSSGLVSKSTHLNTFVNAIDLILRSMGKKWVLVFDQINRLFARPGQKEARDLGTLRFPFIAIDKIMQGGQIVSIVSASANNEIAYKERHLGFDEYNHPCQMDWEELTLAFKVLDTRNDRARILEVTGGVPWQVMKLISSNFSIPKYENAELRIILSSLDHLKETKTKTKFDRITKSAVACVLSTTGDQMEYDRKYSIPVKDAIEHDRKDSIPKKDAVEYASDNSVPDEVEQADKYEPLFPVVIIGYRRYFWKAIMASVNDDEKELLCVCANPKLTNDARGRIFELIVINRCSLKADVTLKGLPSSKELPSLKECNLIELFPSKGIFPSNVLPKIMDEDGMYVPKNCNFPAIDLIWKCGKSVYGVQVHTSDHHNVLKKFTKMCNAAGWHKMFTKIFLIYLSPRQSVSDSVKSNIPQTQGKITVVAVCKSSIPCLTDLQWPDLK